MKISQNALIKAIYVTGGIIPAFIGLMAILGWYFHLPYLIQIHPERVPVRLVTAIAIIMCSIGGFSTYSRFDFLRKTSGFLLVFYGAFVIFEYLAGLNFDVDKSLALFLGTSEESYNKLTSLYFLDNVKIAPTTAASFILMGVALLMTTYSKKVNERQVIFCLMGAIIATVGLMSFVGSFSPPATQLYFSPMAIPTAIALISLGSSLVLFAALQSETRLPFTFWIILITGIAGISLTWIISQAIRASWETEGLTTSSLFFLLKLFVLESFLLTLFLGIMIFLAQQAKIKIKKIQEINHNLESEITQRQRISVALAESENRNKAILDAAVYAIISVDSDGKIITINPSVKEMFHYTEDELVGSPIQRLFNTTTFHEFDTCFQSYLKKTSFTTFVRKRDLLAIKKNGTLFPIDFALSGNSFQGALFFTIIICDISEQKEVERTLIESKKEAEEAKNIAEAANHSKGTFLASMSHEIRTPMNSIIGMADLLDETPLNPEQKQYVVLLKSAGDTLLNLINDILDFTKLEAGLLSIHTVDFNLREVVEKTIAVMEVLASKKNLELKLNIHENLPSNFHGDPLRIRQVLTNLINNAIKFTFKGSIEVVVEKDPEKDAPGALLFSVIDTGIGIPTEKQKFLFERFFQVDPSTTRKHGGAGLGLSICKNLIQMMDGKIGFKSHENHGSIFYFTIQLPIVEQSQSLPPQTVANLNGMRILVVDDYENNRLILNKYLTEWGASVVLAEDGLKGLASIEMSLETQEPFHLIILDSRMPYMDGFEVAKEIKRIPNLQSSLLMMFTSDSHAADIEHAAEIGISRYLIKPIKVAELKEIIFEVAKDLFKDHGESFALSKVVRELKKTETFPTLIKQSSNLASMTNILIVEDSPENFLLLQFYLKNLTYLFDHAENGAIAVQKFKETRYDIVLMDLQMPIMDGYTATREIRKWENENQLIPTPIVALTAYALPAEVQKAFDAGCTHYLTKPIKKATLLETLEQFTTPPQGVTKIDLQKELPTPHNKEMLVIEHDLKEIIPQFLNNIKQNLQEILESVATGDLKKASLYGHQMKGSGTSYGIPKITEIGALIEIEAKNDNSRAIVKHTEELLEYLNDLEIVYL